MVTIYLLFVMHLATRRVHFAGCTTNPDELWMKQIGRNLTGAEDATSVAIDVQGGWPLSLGVASPLVLPLDNQVRMRKQVWAP